jgi:hypothetical protein
LVDERQNFAELGGDFRVLDIVVIREVDERHRWGLSTLPGEQSPKEHAVDDERVGRLRLGNYVRSKFQGAHEGDHLGHSLLGHEPRRRRAPISCARKRAENGAAVADTPCKRGIAQHPYLVATADQSAREREHRGNVAAELGRNKQEPAMLCHRVTPNPAEAFHGLSNLALMHKTEIRLKHSRLGRWLDSPREMRRDFMR